MFVQTPRRRCQVWCRYSWLIQTIFFLAAGCDLDTGSSRASVSFLLKSVVAVFLSSILLPDIVRKIVCMCQEDDAKPIDTNLLLRTDLGLLTILDDKIVTSAKANRCQVEAVKGKLPRISPHRILALSLALTGPGR